MASLFFRRGFPKIGKGTHDDRQETMMIDENLARLRAHRNNVHHYRRLLATQLTDLERTYIERRLSEEQAAMAALSDGRFPLPCRRTGSRLRHPPKRAVMFDVDAFVIRGHQKVIDYYRWLRDSTVSDVERERFQRRMDEESEALRRYLAQQTSGVQNAA
jgi:hypothetical protein